MIVGALLALGCSLALPHEDDDFEFVELVARSDAWPWLHAGLFLAVLLVVAGLYAVVRIVHETDPELATIAAGALLIGTTILLCAIAIAGVALRKAADNVLFVGPGPDLSGSFFGALTLDRVSYALYAAAAITVLGVAPIALGLALWRSRRDRVLGVGGAVAGASSIANGFVAMLTESSTYDIALGSQVLVAAWTLGAGVQLLRGNALSLPSPVA